MPIPRFADPSATSHLSRAATLALARRVVREAEAATLSALFTPSGNATVSGLYAGRLVGSGTTSRLVGYTDVPGVSLDGTLKIIVRAKPPLGFKGTITVRGARATPVTFSIS
jgi:hypothetical protein